MARLLLQAALAFVGIVALAGVSTLSGCRRPCESSDNCKRTCSCLNAQTSSRADCTMAFRCDGAEEVCEPDFDNLSCDQICERYAATATCGFERCAVDEDCLKRLTCPVLDQNGNPTTLTFDCTIPFRCDQDAELCEVASTRPPEVMCREECAGQAG